MKRNKLFIILAIIVFLIGLVIYSGDKSREVDGIKNVSKELLVYFEDNIEFNEIVTHAEEDINNDNKADLIVVYSDNSKNNKMVAIINDKEMYITEPVAAPRENVVITFKDIDSKDEMEVMVSGSKNGSVGYAIFRLEEGKLVDLFGEGMEACC